MVTHPLGTKLWMSIATLEDLRSRCVIDPACECWHLRKADGKPMPRGGKRHVVWIYGQGAVSATRAAWRLAGKPEPKKGRLVFRACASYDCVNPAHLQVGTHASRAAAQKATGRSMTPAKLRANRESGLRRSKVPAEIRIWIAESPQSAAAVAHAVGIWPSYACAIRRRLRSNGMWVAQA
jgi:hypothetical protein